MDPQAASQNSISWPLQVVLQVLVWLGPKVGSYLEKLLGRWVGRGDTYEVMAYSASIEILDARGRRAIYTKRRRLRFLVDNVTVIPDYGWGTGNTFAHHRVRPGRVLEHRAVGMRHRSLIMLPEPQNRGDGLTLDVRRFIKGGFTDHPSWLEAEIGQRTARLDLSVTLPSNCHFKAKRLMNRAGTVAAPVRVRHTSRSGDRLTASVRKPAVGELYTLEFDWAGTGKRRVAHPAAFKLRAGVSSGRLHRHRPWCTSYSPLALCRA